MYDYLVLDVIYINEYEYFTESIWRMDAISSFFFFHNVTPTLVNNIYSLEILEKMLSKQY